MLLAVPASVDPQAPEQVERDARIDEAVAEQRDALLVEDGEVRLRGVNDLRLDAIERLPLDLEKSVPSGRGILPKNPT